MLGPLIADLAINTRKRCIDTFYRSLFDDIAELSPFGYVASRLSLSVSEHKRITREDVESAYQQGSMRCEINGLASSALLLYGYCGWASQNPEDARSHALEVHRSLDLGKESWYAANIIPVLVCQLRLGFTKDEALQEVGQMFRETFTTWDRTKDSALGAVNRAWDAFYRAFDFTSALHSAAKSPVNPHLTTLICGLFAEAMYSCEQVLLKSKYHNGGYHFISCPKHLPDGIKKKWNAIEDFKEKVRTFYPKNRALTNVEFHTWTSIVNPYASVSFDYNMYNAIRMALDTGWENRYGIYLDNGRYYVYRSSFLLYRFRITRSKSGDYCITDLQRSEDPHSEGYTGLQEALYSIEFPPYKDHNHRPIFIPIEK